MKIQLNKLTNYLNNKILLIVAVSALFALKLREFLNVILCLVEIFLGVLANST